MGSSGIPREIYIFAILLFYVFIGVIYFSAGNTLAKINGNNLPDLEKSGYQNNALSDDTNNLLDFVTTGISGYSDSNLYWINYVFILISVILVLLIFVVLAHG